jgi:hypothetical protein
MSGPDPIEIEIGEKVRRDELLARNTVRCTSKEEAVKTYRATPLGSLGADI